MDRYREGGEDALRAKPVPGRPSKLSGGQIARLYALIAGADPRQLSFDFALWTREMVRKVIRREFGVKLSAVSVGRLLRTMGLSPQRPLHRAYQQDPRPWIGGRPRISGHSRPGESRGRDDLLRGRGRDALGLPRRHHLGTGRTDPVVPNTGARFLINMLSVVTPDLDSCLLHLNVPARLPTAMASGSVPRG
ncbi:winged helix-turn-helix domain-containing protein [Saccharopolyspora sp. NPDC000995]